MSPWDLCRRSNKCYGSMAGSCADRTISPLDSRLTPLGCWKRKCYAATRIWKGLEREIYWKSMKISVYHWLIPFITVSKKHVPPRLTKWSWKVHTIGPIGCLLTCWINQLKDAQLRHHLVPIYPHCISSFHPELSWRNLQIHCLNILNLHFLLLKLIPIPHSTHPAWSKYV